MGCAGHFPGRLAGCHQNQPPSGLKDDLIQSLSHGRARKRIAQRGVENVFCILVHFGSLHCEKQNAGRGAYGRGPEGTPP